MPWLTFTLKHTKRRGLLVALLWSYLRALLCVPCSKCRLITHLVSRIRCCRLWYFWVIIFGVCVVYNKSPIFQSHRLTLWWRESIRRGWKKRDTKMYQNFIKNGYLLRGAWYPNRWSWVWVAEIHLGIVLLISVSPLKWVTVHLFLCLCHYSWSLPESHQPRFILQKVMRALVTAWFPSEDCWLRRSLHQLLANFHPRPLHSSHCCCADAYLIVAKMPKC